MLVRLLGNEKYQGITIPMSAIFLSLLAGAVIILSLGKNPRRPMVTFFRGLDSSRNRVMPDIRIC